MIEEWCRGNHDSLKRYELPADVGHVCGVDKVLWSILQLNHHLSHNYSNAKRPCVEITNVVNMDLLPIYVHPNSHTWMDYEEYLRRHYPSEARQRLRYTTGTSSTKKCKEQGNLTTYEDDNLLIASEKVLEMLGHSKNNPLSFDDVSFKIIFCNNS